MGRLVVGTLRVHSFNIFRSDEKSENVLHCTVPPGCEVRSLGPTRSREVRYLLSLLSLFWCVFALSREGQRRSDGRDGRDQAAPLLYTTAKVGNY